MIYKNRTVSQNNKFKMLPQFIPALSQTSHSQLKQEYFNIASEYVFGGINLWYVILVPLHLAFVIFKPSTFTYILTHLILRVGCSTINKSLSSRKSMNIIPVYFMQIFKSILLQFHINKLCPHYYLKKNDYNKTVLVDIKVIKLY